MEKIDRNLKNIQIVIVKAIIYMYYYCADFHQEPEIVVTQMTTQYNIIIDNLI